MWVESEDSQSNPATTSYVNDWKSNNNATFTVVSDPGFLKVYGIMKNHSSSLPHQYVIDGNTMELIHATGGVGSRYTACTENTTCDSGSCITENICQGMTCSEHSDCPSGYCVGGNCKGVACGGDADCGEGSCGVEGVCEEAACSTGSDCPSLECSSSTCRGTTPTEQAWLGLL